jgi:hypothetical protein
MSNREATTTARRIIDAWVSEAREDGKSDVYGSKRKVARYTWDRPLEMLVGEQINYVYARDISSNGLGLVCKFRPRPQEVVHIRSSDAEPWIRCRVAHVTQTVGAYKIGVELRFDVE